MYPSTILKYLKYALFLQYLLLLLHCIDEAAAYILRPMCQILVFADIGSVLVILQTRHDLIFNQRASMIAYSNCLGSRPLIGLLESKYLLPSCHMSALRHVPRPHRIVQYLDLALDVLG